MLIRKFIDDDLDKQYRNFVSYARTIFNITLKSHYEKLLLDNFTNGLSDQFTFNNYEDGDMLSDICTCRIMSLALEPRFLINDSYVVQYFDIIVYGNTKHQYSNQASIEVFLASFLYYDVLLNKIKDTISNLNCSDNSRMQVKKKINNFVHMILQDVLVEDFNTYFKSLIDNINPLILKQPKEILFGSYNNDSN